jgi:hypothetical protein
MYPTPQGSTTSPTEVYVGTFNVRCTVTYKKNFYGPTPPPDVPTTTIAVLPPDGLSIISGDRVSVQLGQNATVIFGVTCDGALVSNVQGYAQERISNVRNALGKIVPVDSGWIPQGGNGPRFYLQGNKIVDMKRYSGNPGQAWRVYWQSLNNGAVFNTATQGIRVMIPDPCGSYTPYQLKTFTVKFVKDDLNHYHVEHSAP